MAAINHCLVIPQEIFEGESKFLLWPGVLEVLEARLFILKSSQTMEGQELAQLRR